MDYGFPTNDQRIITVSFNQTSKVVPMARRVKHAALKPEITCSGSARITRSTRIRNTYIYKVISIKRKALTSIPIDAPRLLTICNCGYGIRSDMLCV